MLAVLPKCGGAVCHTQLTDTAKHSKRTGNVRPASQPLCPPRPLTCQSYHLRLTPPTWHDQILKSVARQQVSAIRPPRGHALTDQNTVRSRFGASVQGSPVPFRCLFRSVALPPDNQQPPPPRTLFPIQRWVLRWAVTDIGLKVDIP
jgi:hypothetical protein